ncbi:hypothetical protein M422DRAFT_56570 [Sphaerobolus stellatus SS14]|uniref:EF-hand domain-containing protein n=1 Tax=Sphaerobolus stellatus (strain SS14) TaxID=990650 RepID=A0A0C9U4L1_SPHS4|nr:hypothetical protein M422DRAFT_56570 [Sphaerobolus stellatus SS14]
MSTYIQLAIEMWSLPRIHPARFLPKYVKQFLSGATYYFPTHLREVALQRIMQMALSPGESTFSLEDLQKALEIIHKAQGLKDTFKLDHLTYLHAIENNSDPILFYHAGIDRVPVRITKQCRDITVDIMGVNEEIDKITAMQAIFSRVESSEYTTHILNSFESAWLLVDTNHSGKIDRNGLYILMYLLSMLRLDVAMPHRLPDQVKDILLSWRDIDMKEIILPTEATGALIQQCYRLNLFSFICDLIIQSTQSGVLVDLIPLSIFLTDIGGLDNRPVTPRTPMVNTTRILGLISPPRQPSRNPFTPGSQLISDSDLRSHPNLSQLHFPRPLVLGITQPENVNRPHLAPGVQALQSQIGQQLNTNIEKQTTSGPPPQQSQGMTAPTSPGDVEMPGRTPGRSPFKSYTDTSNPTTDPREHVRAPGLDSRGATNLNETTSRLTPETISALQTTADAIVNKASE